jgi:AbrB family looped-hinge helix DNA binding protein
MTTKLDEAGRIEIPETVRKALGWKPGTEIDVVATKGEVRLTPVDSEQLLKWEGNVLVFTGELGAQLDVDPVGLIDADREARLRHVAGLKP